MYTRAPSLGGVVTGGVIKRECANDKNDGQEAFGATLFEYRMDVFRSSDTYLVHGTTNAVRITAPRRLCLPKASTRQLDRALTTEINHDTLAFFLR